ncbi:MAG TPA: BamA/TamA family outer membrane protein [Candidatus Binatia bacterium]
MRERRRGRRASRPSSTALATLLAVVAALLFGFVVPRPARAIDRLEADETISQLLVTAPPGEAELEDTAERRRWAILPQIGFGPDTGVLGGLKFTNRNLLGSGATLDVDGIYAIEGQQALEIQFGSPFLLENRMLLLARTYYAYDPQQEFFGLGNNDQGPEPASTNGIQDIGGSITAGWRLYERLSLNAQMTIRNVVITDGRRKGDIPFTRERFPDLPGIDGGTVVPFGLSLVWNNRDDLLRPTRGWRAILKVLHANPSLGSDFEYSQFIVDLGYLRTFFDGNLTFAARFNGEYIQSPDEQTPFWELTELGGDDTLRGFFPNRFLGTSRVLVNTEIRFPIVDFDFFDLWRVEIDGVLFGDGGRVFISDEELRDEFSIDDDLLERIIDDFQYDYGGGFRIKLADALVARIDVGFSDEETGLVYLEFGQTF